MKIIGNKYALVSLEDLKLEKADKGESPSSCIIEVTQKWQLDLHTGECHPSELWVEQL